MLKDAVIKNPKKKSTSRKKKTPATAAALAAGDSNRLEFFRNAIGLLPTPTDRTPGLAILVSDEPREEASRYCSCKAARHRTCPHLLELTGKARQFAGKSTGKTTVPPWMPRSEGASGFSWPDCWQMTAMIPPRLCFAKYGRARVIRRKSSRTFTSSHC